MINPIFLRIILWLATVTLTTSFFVRSKKMLNIINMLQLILFIGIWIVAILSLMWWTLDLPNIFVLSSLRAFFLLILSVVSVGITIYSNYYLGVYLEHKKKLSFYIFLTLIFLFSMIGIIITNEMITFLILWELMSLSSYFLVVHEPQKEGVLTEWAWYFIITHIGFFSILFAFIPFFLHFGSTLFTSRNADTFTTSTKSIIFILALIWFGSKAWIFPIHIWLPKAHPIAPSHISALMSWFMVKIPVLFLFIFIQQFFANQIELRWWVLVLVLGTISAFIGIFYAIVQNNIKKLLAYSTIENIWIIFIWLGVYMIGLYLEQPALIVLWALASLYHTFNHAIFKSLLFISAWSIIERTGTPDIRKLWWLIKSIPWVALSFLIWSWAIIWLPPLNGFNSEIVTIFGVIQWFAMAQNVWMLWLFILVLVVIWMMSATAFYCFVKTFAITFLWNTRDITIKIIDKKSLSERISTGWLMTMIISLAVLPWWILKIVHNILGQESGTISLFNLSIGNTNYVPWILLILIIVLWFVWWLLYSTVVKKSIIKEPWNCGYPIIVPKTQYSWNSFIQHLRRVYAWFFGETKGSRKKSLITLDEVHKKYKQELSSIWYDVNHKYRFDICFERFIIQINKISILVKKLMNWELNLYVAYIFIILVISSFVFYRIY